MVVRLALAAVGVVMLKSYDLQAVPRPYPWKRIHDLGRPRNW